MTAFQEKLAYLDAALTRKDWTTVQHTANTQDATPARFADDGLIYYLSDGGYSRIAYAANARLIYLIQTSGSLHGPRENWANCRELIADVEDAINSHVDA